jgi:hypothetical protein
MSRPVEEDTFALGLADEAEDDDWDDEEDAPGPDERDMDLLDGSWEQKYYSGRQRSVDWNSILVGMGLLALAGMLIPVFLVVFR